MKRAYGSVQCLWVILLWFTALQLNVDEQLCSLLMSTVLFDPIIDLTGVSVELLSISSYLLGHPDQRIDIATWTLQTELF